MGNFRSSMASHYAGLFPKKEFSCQLGFHKLWIQKIEANHIASR